MRLDSLVCSLLAFFVVASATPATAGEAVVPRKDPRVAWLVATEGGLRVVDSGGAVVRILSKTPATWPRQTPGGAVVFVTADRTEVRRVGADGRGETRVATLPKSVRSCGEGAEDIALADLSVQTERDAFVTADGKQLWLELLDRNVNMADYDVTVRVDLVTGAVTTAVTMPAGCPERLAIPWPSRPATAPEKRPAFDWDVVVVKGSGKLVRRAAGGKPKSAVALGRAGNFEPEALSPSGRWRLVSGNASEGDYMHRDLFLLDRQAGALYPLRAGAWPAPIPAAKLVELSDGAVETTDAVGESTTAWDATADVLRVDTLVVRPGVGAVQLGGDVAPFTQP